MRLPRHWPLWVGAAGLFAMLAPALVATDAVGATDDWRWFLFHWEVTRASISQFGQLPGWNPFHCGGHVHWANPQTQVLSPIAWVARVAGGSGAALKLFTLFHGLLGLGSMWFLAGVLRLPAAARGVAAAIWTLCGFFAWHVGGGHVAFQPLFYAPAALALGMSGRWVGAAGVVALMVLEGGAYPAAFTALLLAVHLGWREPVAWMGSMGLAALLSAAKSVPALVFLMDHPRRVKMEDRVGLSEVAEMFLSRSQAWEYGDHVFVWPEYASYVGVGVFALVGILVALSRGRTFRWSEQGVWWVGLGVFSGIMMGDHGPASPYSVLHLFPPFSGMRVPSRFAVLVTLHLAVLAGYGLAAVRASLRKRPWGPVLVAGVLMGVTADLSSLGQARFSAFTERIGSASIAPGGFRMTARPWRQAMTLPAERLGTTACYEPHRLPKGAVHAELPSEAFAADGARGTVRVRRWSPNRVEVHGRLTRPGLVVLNQNDHRGWEGWSTMGPIPQAAERTSRRGMPAIRLPVGPFHVTFTYRIPGLYLGLIATALGIVIALVTLRRGQTP